VRHGKDDCKLANDCAPSYIGGTDGHANPAQPAKVINPSFLVRKPLTMLLRPILAYGAAVFFALRYDHHWLAAFIVISYAVGVAMTPLTVRVTATDVFVRTLFKTAQYELRDIGAIALTASFIPGIRLQMRDTPVKITGFSLAQLKSLRDAIEAARSAAEPHELTRRSS
jgi:hypothetical protein